MATGIKTKPMPFPPRIAIIGLAPAGGWIILNEAITKTDKATAIPSDNGLDPIKANITTPLRADKIWPKIIFFGWAKGLSWTPITKTIEAPNGGINSITEVSKELKYARQKIHKNAPKEAKISVLTVVGDLNIFFIKNTLTHL